MAETHSNSNKQTYTPSVDEHVMLPTTGGLRLACKLWTVKDKPVSEHEVKVICYPGWLDNAASFDFPAEILCREFGFALLCVDPPGCGLSDWRPLSAIYNDFDEVPMIADLADELGWDEFVLMGHSRGGGLCSLAAGLLGERVKVLVCIDSFFSLSGNWRYDMLVPKPHCVKQMRDARDMAKKNLVREPRVFATFEEAVDEYMNNPLFQKKIETARIIVKRNLRPCKEGFTYTHDVRTYGQLQYIHVPESTMEEFIASITAPMMHIADCARWKEFSSANESMLPSYIDRNRWYKGPLMKVVNLEGRGHHLHSDASREFCDIVGPFILEQCRRQQSAGSPGSNKSNL